MVSTGIGKRFMDGEVIVQEGTPADRLYVVLQGEVELTTEGLPLSVLPSGSIFGELSLLDGETHMTTVRARGETRILTIDRRMLLRRCREDPAFAIRILTRLAQRTRDLMAELVDRKRAGAPAL